MDVSKIKELIDIASGGISSLDVVVYDEDLSYREIKRVGLERTGDGIIRVVLTTSRNK